MGTSDHSSWSPLVRSDTDVGWEGLALSLPMGVVCLRTGHCAGQSGSSTPNSPLSLWTLLCAPPSWNRKGPSPHWFIPRHPVSVSICLFIFYLISSGWSSWLRSVHQHSCPVLAECWGERMIRRKTMTCKRSGNQAEKQPCISTGLGSFRVM